MLVRSGGWNSFARKGIHRCGENSRFVILDSPRVILVDDDLLLRAGRIRGRSHFDLSASRFIEANEAENALPLGYYEALIGTPGRVADATASGPPPGWLPFGGEETGIVRELPSYLRWNMKPNLDIRWNGSVFRTNRLGFRTPEVSSEKPAGTYRIVVFGSSNTMGYGVSDDEMYTISWRSGSGTGRAVASRRGREPVGRRRLAQSKALPAPAGGGAIPARLVDLRRSVLRLLAGRYAHPGRLGSPAPGPVPFVEEAIRRTGVTPGETAESFRAQIQGESERMYDAVYAGWSAEVETARCPDDRRDPPAGGQQREVPRVLQLIRSLADRHGLDCLDVSTPSMPSMWTSSGSPPGISIPMPKGIA